MSTSSRAGTIVARRWTKLDVAVWVLLAGIAALNIRSSHNWGGDFSMYIRQAKNIVAGIPQEQNGYVYAPETTFIGPKAYSIGFPLFLAPFCWLLGDSIRTYTTAISVAAFVFSLSAWAYFFSLFRHRGWAFALTAMISLNPWFVEFKGSVLSDIPFSAAVILFTFLVEEKRPPGKLGILLTGMLAGYAFSIRTAGVAIFGALFFTAALSWYRGRGRTAREWMRPLQAAGIGVGMFVLLQVAFPTPTMSSYADSLNFASLAKQMAVNAQYYLVTMREIIPNSGPVFLQTLFYHFSVVGIVWGFCRRVRSGPRYTEWFFALYLLVLLAWPGTQGFRFLLPIAPIALGYVGESLRAAFPRAMEGTKSSRFATAAIVITLVLFQHPTLGVQKRAHQVIDGPQLEVVQEAFARVRETVPEGAVVAFHNPRVLALYTDRPGVADGYSSDLEETRRFLTKMKAQFLLFDIGMHDSASRKVAERHGSLLWSNSRYQLFALNLRDGNPAH
jgi:hypothetical protein